MQTEFSKMYWYLEYLSIFCIMMLSIASAGCPSKCACFNTMVRCREKSLMDIPNFETLNIDPYVIDLSSNDIDFITYYSLSFDKAEIVQILYLNDSKIIDVDDKAFKELSGLKELYLSQNLLGDLPPNSFKYNDNLILLDLSYNLFRKMPKLICSNLKILNLMSSGIEEVNLDRFNKLPNLEYLYLQKNNIRTLNIEMFKNLPRLISVELEYNAWICNCESVKIFEHLNSTNMIKVKEPIQCRTKNDFFITIFDENGAPEAITAICKNSGRFEGELEEIDTTTTMQPITRTFMRKHKMQRKKFQKMQQFALNTTCEHIKYITPFTITNYVIFSLCLLFAFITGLVLGNIAFARKNIDSNHSSSFRSLLKKDVV